MVDPLSVGCRKLVSQGKPPFSVRCLDTMVDPLSVGCRKLVSQGKPPFSVRCLDANNGPLSVGCHWRKQNHRITLNT